MNAPLFLALLRGQAPNCIESLVCLSCALLLRLSMLGSLARLPRWRAMPAPRLQVLAPRPSFGLNKHGKRGVDNSEYAWFLWGWVFEWLPPIGWLNWKKEGGRR